MKIRVTKEFSHDEDIDPRAAAMRDLGAELVLFGLQDVFNALRKRDDYNPPPKSWDEVREFLVEHLGDEVMAILHSA